MKGVRKKKRCLHKITPFNYPEFSETIWITKRSAEKLRELARLAGTVKIERV